MHHILLTDAGPSLVDAAKRAFPGCAVHVSHHELMKLPERPFDKKIICFVDWLPAEMSGLEICRQLHFNPITRGSHITMVLNGNDGETRARALASGADDYIAGPLTFSALQDRLYTHFVSPTFAVDNDPELIRTHFGLTLNPTSLQVRLNGRLIHLKPREVRVLEIFLLHPDRLLSRARIIALLEKADEVADERTVDVWVGRLRRALQMECLGNVIRTVRPLGYVFDTPVAI